MQKNSVVYFTIILFVYISTGSYSQALISFYLLESEDVSVIDALNRGSDQGCIFVKFP